VILPVFLNVFTIFLFDFNQQNGAILTQKYLIWLLLPKSVCFALLLTGSIWDLDVAVEICILMLRIDKMLQLTNENFAFPVMMVANARC